MVTTPVQTRLDCDLARLIDSRAKAAGITRAQVLRQLVEGALAAPEAFTADPTLDRLLDGIGALAANLDAVLTTSRNAAAKATAAHAAARLGALMLLPAERQQVFIDKLAGAQP